MPAFPTVDANRAEDYGTYGLTMRDYFAAKAMQGLIASNDAEAGDRLDGIPEYAYQIADAMIKARKGGSSD
ncbi:hypothetical protein L1889_18095 [Paenalcaligenes niemegkensis]|uniref:hypothetical protein n=1 Tax=Paenalcaligenes niemegkensis TaxID=2895469 RepID=UPI001EE8B9CD|nr:hypothetical protein [Paenalcaligenes niemegkensis]MCQ9618352.1 hypothetical protein [Paenalcaligenes niemegkensis]